MNNVVTCNKCGKEILMNVKTKTKKINGELITQLYLRCPNCGAIYGMTYESRITKIIKKRIEKDRNKLNKELARLELLFNKGE